MVIVENFTIALAALRANKMRSILTTLGIIIGVAAVIAVVSVVQGLQFMLTNVFEDVGATYMFVIPRQERNDPGMVTRQVKLTLEDGEAIAEQVTGIREITPIIIGSQQVKYRDRQHRPGYILGVNQDYQEVMNHTVDRGRFFSRLDLENRSKVAVIGLEIVEELRLGSQPVGKEIYIGNLPVTVIGVMEERGQALGQDQDDMLFLPFDTALTLFGRNAADQVQLHLRTESTEVMDRVKDDITRLLRRRHDLAEGTADDFEIRSQEDTLDFVTNLLGGVTAVVGGIVSVALLVGGIGIMNIMLVSVTERTREIGVRKAVGAKKRDILLQFLIEAITLSLFGGALGLALGYGLGALAIQLIPGDLPPAHVPLWAVGLAFGFSALVGVFFGIYPAGKAARLDPIDALRYE
jgi:putative ABC transport system permease protein